MKKRLLSLSLMFITLSGVNSSCQKDSINSQQNPESASNAGGNSLQRDYDLNILLIGVNNQPGNSDNGQDFPSGLLKFRQDPDPQKIISLDTRVGHLQPNHEYQLQRAVDLTIDGNCTGTSWLTLGKGLVAQSILTDETGKGSAELWRDVTAIATGSVFDIHFQVIDAVTKEVVLKSDCYQYTVR